MLLRARLCEHGVLLWEKRACPASSVTKQARNITVAMPLMSPDSMRLMQHDRSKKPYMHVSPYHAGLVSKRSYNCTMLIMFLCPISGAL